MSRAAIAISLSIAIGANSALAAPLSIRPTSGFSGSSKLAPLKPELTPLQTSLHQASPNLRGKLLPPSLGLGLPPSSLAGSVTNTAAQAAVLTAATGENEVSNEDAGETGHSQTPQAIPVANGDPLHHSGPLMPAETQGESDEARQTGGDPNKNPARMVLSRIASLTPRLVASNIGLALAKDEADFTQDSPTQSGAVQASADNSPLSANGLAPARNPSPVHGMPGRLIVVEGLDGSGKSTQLELIQKRLEAQGVKVVNTIANSSPLFAQATKDAKRAGKAGARRFSAHSFSLTQQLDLSDRIDNVIRPALEEGAVVLADRYAYTDFARGRARGLEPGWLRQAVEPMLIQPDQVLYFRMPVDKAVDRVLKRRQGKAILSEDAEDQSGTPRVSHWEGGLDQRLADDPVENMRLFQTQVAAEYDNMVGEFGFQVIDADQTIDAVAQDADSVLAEVLGDLSQYARAEPNNPLVSAPPAQLSNDGGISSFFRGTFASQFASKSLDAVQFILTASLVATAAEAFSKEYIIGVAGMAITAASFADTLGTAVGGWITDKVHPKKVLVYTMAARFIATAGVMAAIALISNGMTLLISVSVLFIIDGFSRGIEDSAREAYPMTLAGQDHERLETLNADYHQVFEWGSVAGPVAIAAMALLIPGSFWVMAPVPLGFAAAGWLYSRAKVGKAQRYDAAGQAPVSTRNFFGNLLHNPLAVTALLGLAVSTLYPLRSVLPGLFAPDLSLFGSTDIQFLTAVLTAVFGIGGVIGSRFYKRFRKSLTPSGWLTAGAAVTALWSLSWTGGSSIALISIGVTLFAAMNMASRLAVKGVLQSQAQEGAYGRTMGLSRFVMNFAADAVKGLVALAFLLSASAGGAFSLLALGFLAFALAQASIAYLLWRYRAARRGVFLRNAQADNDTIRGNLLKKNKGPHFFLRVSLHSMRERFAQLLDHTGMPTVYLHGNTNVANFAQTANGAAMVDFDRAAYGPYAWDLIRFLVSLSILRKKKDERFLANDVADKLLEGYLHGLDHADEPFPQYLIDEDFPAMTTNDYFEQEGKWIREFRKTPLEPDHPKVVALLERYVEDSGEAALLTDYVIEEAGRGFGSMANNDRVLILLRPRDESSGNDRILLDIKEVYADESSRWYKNPFSNQVERMMKAHDLYSPGWLMRPGRSFWDGTEYFVRQVPPHKEGLGFMRAEEQRRLAYSVGAQLGRAHRLSLEEIGAEEVSLLKRHARGHFAAIVEAGAKIRDEVVAAHQDYLSQIGESEDDDTLDAISSND